MRARSSSMVMSCSASAVIIVVTDAVVLARACSSWPRLRVTGLEVRACSILLVISPRMRAGSASRQTMWSQTARSR